jgi:hypothetical protein
MCRNATLWLSSLPACGDFDREDACRVTRRGARELAGPRCRSGALAVRRLPLAPLIAWRPALGLKSTRSVVDAFDRHIGVTAPTAEASPRLVRRSLRSMHRAGAPPSGSRFRLFSVPQSSLAGHIALRAASFPRRDIAKAEAGSDCRY